MSDQLVLLDDVQVLIVNSWRCFGVYKFSNLNSSLTQLSEIKLISSVQLNLSKFDFKIIGIFIVSSQNKSYLKFNFKKVRNFLVNGRTRG
jgi:hypothetical protein